MSSRSLAHFLSLSLICLFALSTQIGCDSAQQATEVTATEDEIEAYEKMIAEMESESADEAAGDGE